MYHVYFPYKSDLDINGRGWFKAVIVKVGLFSVKIAHLDKMNNITFEMWYPVSWKDREIAKSLKGRPMHMTDLADREWFVRDWPWESKNTSSFVRENMKTLMDSAKIPEGLQQKILEREALKDPANILEESNGLTD